MENIYKEKLSKNITQEHPLYQKIKDNFRITCNLFNIDYDPTELRIKDNIISGYDPNKKEIITFIHENNKTILMIYGAPSGKPIKLKDVKYTAV
ncbi:MAG: hypothetical protein WC356_06585 [Candidatus Micrarchaeia archaeon]|jgi:uncharacterized membrane protein